MQSKLKSAEAELGRCKAALSEHISREGELRIESQRISDEADALEDALENDQVVDGQLEALQSTLKDREEEQKLAINSLDDAKAALDNIKGELLKQRRLIAAKDAEIRPLEENVTVAESECVKVDEQRRAVLAEKNQAYDHVKDLKEERDARAEDKARLDARVADYSEKAGMVSPRVPIDEGETTESLDKKLDKLYKDLDRYDQQ